MAPLSATDKSARPSAPHKFTSRRQKNEIIKWGEKKKHLIDRLCRGGFKDKNKKNNISSLHLKALMSHFLKARWEELEQDENQCWVICRKRIAILFDWGGLYRREKKNAAPHLLNSEKGSLFSFPARQISTLCLRVCVSFICTRFYTSDTHRGSAQQK